MHPAEQLLTDLYGKFATGDMPGMLTMCDDSNVVHRAG